MKMTKNKDETDQGRPNSRPLVRDQKRFLLDIMVEPQEIVDLPDLYVGYRSSARHQGGYRLHQERIFDDHSVHTHLQRASNVLGCVTFQGRTRIPEPFGIKCARMRSIVMTRTEGFDALFPSQRGAGSWKEPGAAESYSCPGGALPAGEW